MRTHRSHHTSRVLACSMLLGLVCLVASASDGLSPITRTAADGTTTPYARLQDAIAAAAPGDLIAVPAGVVVGTLTTEVEGTANAPIVVRGAGRERSVMTSPGRVVTLRHAWWRIENLTIDGQYGSDDTVRIGRGAGDNTLKNVEVRRSARDCIDISSGADDLTIEDSLVHHCLNAANGRSDAHGIVAGAVRRLRIHCTEIHTFSGDAFQADPGRDPRGWDEIEITASHFWLQPLPASENGFPPGTVPGENAIDTKVALDAPRARLRITDSRFHGFRGGLITNMAALNLKERIDAVIDGVTVWDSEIAFRLRGPESTGAFVGLRNIVVHDVETALRYEDDIQGVRVWHATFGGGIKQTFQAASSPASLFDVRNSLFLAPTLPREVTNASNRRVDDRTFANAQSHDYHLARGSAAIDAGEALDGVATDRDGRARPSGAAPDLGAYEHCASCPGAPNNVRVVR